MKSIAPSQAESTTIHGTLGKQSLPWGSSDLGKLKETHFQKPERQGAPAADGPGRFLFSYAI